MPVSSSVLWIFRADAALYGLAVMSARIGVARKGQSIATRPPVLGFALGI